jgi:NAD(P)-dependent dehydrogenase (short-subunit alcohol dehydrogenase family)
MTSEGSRVAIVTGGAGGLGGAIAARLLADGFRVAVADIGSAAAREIAGRETAGQEALAVEVDVTWLASERCSFSTGAAFDLSGGRAVY